MEFAAKVGMGKREPWASVGQGGPQSREETEPDPGVGGTTTFPQVWCFTCRSSRLPPLATRFPTAPGERGVPVPGEQGVPAPGGPGAGARGGRGGGGRVLQPKQLGSAGHCPHGARGHCSQRCGSQREGSFPRLVPPPTSPPPQHSHRDPQPLIRGGEKRQKTPQPTKNKRPGVGGRGARGPPSQTSSKLGEAGEGAGGLPVPAQPCPSGGQHRQLPRPGPARGAQRWAGRGKTSDEKQGSGGGIIYLPPHICIH